MTLTEKIIELVPEIKERKYYDQGEIVANEPSITLADVLRAIQTLKPPRPIAVNAFGDFEEETGYEDTEILGQWNLSADLDRQSAETKAFLSKILCV